MSKSVTGILKDTVTVKLVYLEARISKLTFGIHTIGLNFDCHTIGMCKLS